MRLEEFRHAISQELLRTIEPPVFESGSGAGELLLASDTRSRPMKRLKYRTE